ncbi:YIP1 family protein [Planctomycetota bacterium]|nr:YIP1 family protein [Planctomycetota bacterium]
MSEAPQSDAPQSGPTAIDCPTCGAPLIGGEELCHACGHSVAAARDVINEDPPPNFVGRVVGILTAPFRTFQHHEAGWGWAAPWILVTLVGVAFGILYLSSVDVGALAEAEFERAIAEMPKAQRDNPQMQEGLEMGRKWGVFMAKTGGIMGPPLGCLLDVLIMGGLIFVACLVLRGPKTRVELMRCISVTAYCELVYLLYYGGKALAVLFGSEYPDTSLRMLADMHTQQVAAAVFSRIDPILIYYYVVLAAGLNASCKLSRAKSWLVSFGLYGLVTVLAVGAAAAGAAMSGKAGP